VANNEYGSYSSSSGFDGDSISDAATGVKDQVKDQAAKVKDQAAKYGQKAVEAVDASRSSAASSLENAAAGIRDNADRLPGGPQVGQFARQTADKLGATADYLREHEAKDIVSDFQSFLKAHPAQALIGAVVVGFLAGRSMRS